MAAALAVISIAIVARLKPSGSPAAAGASISVAKRIEGGEMMTGLDNNRQRTGSTAQVSRAA